MKKRMLCLALACLAAGCRFGGPSESSTTWQALDTDAGASGNGQTSNNGGSGAAGQHASQAGHGGEEAGTSGSHKDASTMSDSLDDAGSSGDECVRPMVAVCDPVMGSGCAASTQCDVDLAQLVLAGRCAFSSPTDAGACIASPFTESCPTKQTCNAGVCRRLCACDSDCDTAECCSEALGTLGFKMCAACP